MRSRFQRPHKQIRDIFPPKNNMAASTTDQLDDFHVGRHILLIIGHVMVMKVQVMKERLDSARLARYGNSYVLPKDLHITIT